MSRTPSFRQLILDFRLAMHSAESGTPIEECLEERRTEISRRGLIKGAGALALTTALPRPILAATAKTYDVGIVGAGLAGLVCANELKRAGVLARVYEASDRTGGRQWSLSGLFPGQVVERGGELIDNLHKTMIGYAREFGLTLEDVNKVPGEVLYYFGSKRHSESEVVREYRAFVEVMRVDLTKLSGGPTALSSNEYDRQLDKISLAEYLAGNNGAKKAAGPIATAAISECYKAEYGLDASQQSCLNFLMFIHADRRARFQPWGVFSDERYHVVEGNDKIAAGLTAKIQGQIELDRTLVKVAKNSAGKIALTFTNGKSTIVKTHDQVVLTLPFTVLRKLTLDPSLMLSPAKLNAINQLGYGDNAKMMIGFKGRPWAHIGCNGASYSDLMNHQTTWETNPTKATANSSVITDYASAERGARFDPKNDQMEALRFLVDFEKVVPNASSKVAPNADGSLRVHMEAWPRNPLSRGSYTCYRPGQFTTIAGLEGLPEGNLYFGGEHTNSFYEWQGFMEGACLSGIATAKSILK